MKKILFSLLLASFVFGGDTLLIGAGAGYKKPVMVVIENLKKDGINVEAAFANIKQITVQAKEGKMALIIGDEAFLDKSGLDIKGYERIGKGTLALVSLKQIQDPKDIVKFSKIAIPDPKKAIYGIRATQYLKNANLQNELEGKILAVSTVPQVVAYVLNAEVDTGFINSTEAKARKSEFGSVIYVDESLYEPVFISAAKLHCSDEICAKFLDELKSERSKAIFAKFGLK
ncbi:molybdate ABC transporter periplasmic molybdate-binding protein [Campylobacter hyointestinalis subsp. hyointestinalis]|uniref:Molybdate ABC transporter periplasmic molybdate-binding protein n=4 Tax=Campylobacter hyointestinalis TaxID=198 RepID=A0A9W5AMS4_CAMHY|nr:molybdate ABC transporter substrate-binding protein [Campylobacter hyointestinalis]PPB53327.1 molybdate ABC transporter substrate-binding protein [Campylobacter hyointestinalis subsp. hyointestinalis]PPB55160.1 molybdate ABC transporter substrate-binding protein [Campylobacter hyointestinalis subsp. hyointestinalis]PPB59888.1 molybdate ABC transporter substrate-binding protein [Campylobacter hyointestinalis subsp. hyointestinalis]PPB64532.1 molybdate ABC transporter substrate-binding protein